MERYLLQDVPIGEQLKKLRLDANLTQEQLAIELQKMGHTSMCREKISQMETGKRNIRVSILKDLKKFYNAKHYDVFSESPPKSDTSEEQKSNTTIWKSN